MGAAPPEPACPHAGLSADTINRTIRASQRRVWSSLVAGTSLLLHAVAPSGAMPTLEWACRPRQACRVGMSPPTTLRYARTWPRPGPLKISTVSSAWPCHPTRCHKGWPHPRRHCSQSSGTRVPLLRCDTTGGIFLAASGERAPEGRSNLAQHKVLGSVVQHSIESRRDERVFSRPYGTRSVGYRTNPALRAGLRSLRPYGTT